MLTVSDRRSTILRSPWPRPPAFQYHVGEMTMYDLRRLNHLSELDRAPAMAGFRAFDAKALGAGALPVKTKELIALGVALTTQCVYCLEIHNQAARKSGATDEEIAEVVMVAAALRAGAAVTHGLHLLSPQTDRPS